MRVDREVDFLGRELVLPRHRQLVNQLGCVGADYVRSKNLAVTRVANDFDETFGFSRRAGPAVSGEGKASDLVVDLLLLALRLRHSDGGNFRMTISRVGNVAVVDEVHVLLAGEQLGENHPLPRALL